MATALGLCRALRTCVIFDDGQYRNWATSYMHTVPTWDHRRPEEYREQALSELLGGNYSTVHEISTSPILSVTQQVVESSDPAQHARPQKIFVATDQNGVQWYGRTVIFASGVEDVLPNKVSMPGFVEGWGQSIFHCLFCHGFEERNASSAGILVLVPEAFQFSAAFAGMVSKLARKVTIYTNGWIIEDPESQDSMYIKDEQEHEHTVFSPINSVPPSQNEQSSRDQQQQHPGDKAAIKRLLFRNGFEIDERPIKRLVPYKTNVDRSNEDDSPSIDIHFDDGSVVNHTFVVCRPNQQVRNRKIMEELGVRFNQVTGLVEVASAMNMTDVPGVFVAGDNTTMFQQIVNAFCQGGMVAGGIHHFLLTKELNGEQRW